MGDLKINGAQLLLKDGNLAELALSLNAGITYFTLSNATTAGLPSSEAKWSYGYGVILVRNTRGEDAKIILHSVMTSEVAINTCYNGVWTGWDSYITNTDLTGTRNRTIIKRTQAGQPWTAASPTIVLEGTPGISEALVLASFTTNDGTWSIGTQSNFNALYFRYMSKSGTETIYTLNPTNKTATWS